MSRYPRRALLLLLGLFLAGCATGAPKPMRLGAWVTYWDYHKGIDSVQSAPSVLSDVYFFAVHLDSEGTPTFANKNILFDREADRIKESKAFPWLTVVNDVTPSAGGPVLLKDPQIIHHLLGDPDRRQQHRSEIVKLAAMHGFSGVDIDYENLWAEKMRDTSLFIVGMVPRAQPGAGADRIKLSHLSGTVSRRLTFIVGQHTQRDTTTDATD